MRLSGRVIGCALEVHRQLGCGFPELAYERALSMELHARSMAHGRQVRFPLPYKKAIIGQFIADIVVQNELVVELKVTAKILPLHEAQLLNYLRASGHRVGLLLNYGCTSLEIKRKIIGDPASQLI